MKLNAFLTRLVQQFRPVAALQPVAPMVPTGEEQVEVEPEERPLGCGWFDSSHELQSGLMVREHNNAEALACELPLAQWLEMQLGSWGVMRTA